MTPPYNLLHEFWLPVRWHNGDPPTEIGLREALIRAHDIEELATDNPLETIALNRLLAALTASVFPEIADRRKWFSCWKQEKFNIEQCDAYFAEFADQFDLLSPTQPFYGHPNTEAKEISPVSRLFHAATSGNNALLFSHDLDSLPHPLTMAQAARALVCTQATALGGGVAKPFNLSHAPLVGGAYFWLRGSMNNKGGGKPSLFKALLLNLAPTSDVWGQLTDDRPIWETIRETVAKTGKLPEPRKYDVGGIRDLFTFQSRRLQLILTNDRQKGSALKVIGVRYNQGSKIERLLFHDPHAAYVVGKETPYPLRFSTEHSLWQDSAAYMMTLTKKGEGGHAPRTFEWLSGNLDNLGLDRRAAFSADVFGMVNDQAKVELWRQERVTIYPDILTDADRWETLNESIVYAKMIRNNRLREATRAFATRVRLNKSWGGRLSEGERGDRDALVLALDTDNRYWPALGMQFDALLAQIATVPVENLGKVRKEWEATVRTIAVSALKGVLDIYQATDYVWQAYAEAEIVLRQGTLYLKLRKGYVWQKIILLKYSEFR